MKIIIMAGGKGTRIASVVNNIPKPMIPVCGKPILEHQIDVLKKNKLTDITLVVGYLSDQIMDYFGDGSHFKCNIDYFCETEPLGTAGALYKMEDLPDDFILLNGDTIFDIDFSRMIAFHKEKKSWATIAVHPNSHPYDSALIISDNNDQVTGWLNKEDERTYYKNQVNAGIHILSKEIIKNCPQNRKKIESQPSPLIESFPIDLDRDILKPMIKSGKIFAYSTPEYIKDTGTPERYAQVSSDMENGIVQQKNLSSKQKCVFLDRDGTINVFNGLVTKPEEMELIDGVSDAIKTINSLGFLVIVITNQPVIARGDVDFETLDLIHMKMETLLGKNGAYIDDLFYCPHHPDKGFDGEKLEFKIDCDCRKPKPGMILKAAEKYNIDLSLSYMAGDDKRDVQAGINAGCKAVFLSNDEIEAKKLFPDSDIQIFPNLKEFAASLAETVQ